MTGVGLVGQVLTDEAPGPGADPITVAVTNDIVPVLTSAEVYRIIRGRLAAHVIIKASDGRVRVRPYVNLQAAEGAVRRARERGLAATVVMVRQDVAPLVDTDGGGRRGAT